MTLNRFQKEIEALGLHASGEKTMTEEEIADIEETLALHTPYTDDWASHGFESPEEWAKATEELLADLAGLRAAWNDAFPEG